MPRHGSHASRQARSLMPLVAREMDERSPALRHLCGGGEAGIAEIRRQLVAEVSRGAHGVDLPLEPYRRYTRRAWQEVVGRRRHTLLTPVREI